MDKGCGAIGPKLGSQWIVRITRAVNILTGS